MSNHYCNVRKHKKVMELSKNLKKRVTGEMRRKDGELPMDCDRFWTMVMVTCQKSMQRAIDLSWSQCSGTVVWIFNYLCILYHSLLYLFTVLWILRLKSTTTTTLFWCPVNTGYWAPKKASLEARFSLSSFKKKLFWKGGFSLTKFLVHLPVIQSAVGCFEMQDTLTSYPLTCL